MKLARNDEIDGNYHFFQTHVAGLMSEHAGEYALLRHQEVVKIYTTLAEAVTAGHSIFADNMFSIQEVTDRPLDLGFFSHATVNG